MLFVKQFKNFSQILYLVLSKRRCLGRVTTIAHLLLEVLVGGLCWHLRSFVLNLVKLYVGKITITITTFKLI